MYKEDKDGFFLFCRVTIVLLIAGMMVLQEFGLEIGPIIAGAEVLGLAIGFGAQSPVKDIINGFFILMENQFAVGDVVRIAGVAVGVG